MDAMAALGDSLGAANLALVDLDRFKAVHASLGDAGGDMILLHTARAVERALGERGAAFPRRRRRVCPLLCAGRGVSRKPRAMRWWRLRQPPHPYDGRRHFRAGQRGRGGRRERPDKLLR